MCCFPRKTNAKLEPYSKSHLRVPGGGYMTVEKMHRNDDRTAQNHTCSIIGSASQCAASMPVANKGVGEMNERGLPVFEMSCFSDRVVDSGECVFRLGCSVEDTKC